MGYLCFRRAQTNYFVETVVEQALFSFVTLRTHRLHTSPLCEPGGTLQRLFFSFVALGWLVVLFLEV